MFPGIQSNEVPKIPREGACTRRLRAPCSSRRVSIGGVVCSQWRAPPLSGDQRRGALTRLGEETPASGDARTFGWSTRSGRGGARLPRGVLLRCPPVGDLWRAPSRVVARNGNRSAAQLGARLLPGPPCACLIAARDSPKVRALTSAAPRGRRPSPCPGVVSRGRASPHERHGRGTPRWRRGAIDQDGGARVRRWAHRRHGGSRRGRRHPAGGTLGRPVFSACGFTTVPRSNTTMLS